MTQDSFQTVGMKIYVVAYANKNSPEILRSIVSSLALKKDFAVWCKYHAVNLKSKSVEEHVHKSMANILLGRLKMPRVIYF